MPIQDIRLLDWQRLKNMMSILLVALYFLSDLGEGLRLEILAGHIVAASKRFYGVTEFCYDALAEGVGTIAVANQPPRKAKPPPKNNPQELLPGFL